MKSVTLHKGKENGIPFPIDIPGGQNTGFFLDQRDSIYHPEGEYLKGLMVEVG